MVYYRTNSMKKIIIPTDFSTTSGDALRFGCYLADATGYDLEVVHVHDGYDNDRGLVVMKGSARIRSRVRERVEKFVRQHADQLTYHGMPDGADKQPLIRAREVVGQAVGQLVKLSRGEDTALLVMGGVGSGKENTASLLFGSVAREVAMRAACPVFLIPSNGGVPDIRYAAISFDYAGTLAELSEKTDFLRQAFAPAMHFAHVRYRNPRSEEVLMTELLRKSGDDDFPDYAADYDLLPATDDVADALFNYTVENKVDLLVLGRYPESFLTRLLFSSKLPDIIDSSGTPLLIIPLDK